MSVGVFKDVNKEDEPQYSNAVTIKLPVAKASSRMLFQYRQAIIEMVVELFPPHDQDRWMLTPHPALNGDWPALAMQKGKEEAVYRLLVGMKRGIGL